MEVDESLKRWCEARVSVSLKTRADEIKHLFNNPENRSALLQFFLKEDVRNAFIVRSKNSRQLHVTLTQQDEDCCEKYVVLVKTEATKITSANIADTAVVQFEWSHGQSLDLFACLTRTLFLPLVSCKSNSRSKSLEVMSKILNTTQVISGKHQGSIKLALPALEVLSELLENKEQKSTVVYILETTFIGWVKQVKNELTINVSDYITKNFSKSPKPFAEIQFWRDKLVCIETMNRQLRSPQVVRIICILNQAGSVYSASIHNIKRELAKAEEDVCNSLQYLKTLEPYFNSIESNCSVHELSRLFTSMCHTLLLVWTYSRFYHTPVNFRRLLKMIVNQVFCKVKKFTSQHSISDPQMKDNVRNALQVCKTFRVIYTDTKAKADAINQIKLNDQENLSDLQFGVTWHSQQFRTARTQRGTGLFKDTGESHNIFLEGVWVDSPWPEVFKSSVFSRVNALMERYNDILELVDVSEQFKKLEDISDVVTDQNSLQVLDLKKQFNQVLSQLYSKFDDILELGPKQNFEAAFFEFRTQIKDIELHLGCLLCNQLNECWDGESRLRVLNIFHGVACRDIPKSVLAPCFEAVQTSMSDCITQARRELSQGVAEFYEQIEKTAPFCLANEKGWDIKSSYKELTEDLKRKEAAIIKEWLTSFDVEVLERLKENVVVMDSASHSYVVNFNTDLRARLHEVITMCTLNNVQLSEHQAQRVDLKVIRVAEACAKQLQMAVAQFNEVVERLKPQERALMLGNIEKAENLLNEGATRHTWKDLGMEEYVARVYHFVCFNLARVSTVTANNFSEIVAVVESWSEGSVAMCCKGRQVHTVEQFNKLIADFLEGVNNKVTLGSRRVESLLQNTLQALEISALNQEWLKYKRLVNDLITSALERCVKNFLVALRDFTQPKQSEVQACLRVDLHLVGTTLYFTPPIDEKYPPPSLYNHFETHLQNILQVATLPTPLITSFDYYTHVSNNKEITTLKKTILNSVKDILAECYNFVDIFKDYEFLWSLDIEKTFKEFLDGTIKSVVVEKIDETQPVRSACSRDSTSSFTAFSEATLGIGVLKVAEEKDRKPTLDDFHREINIFKSVLVDLTNLPLLRNISWLRVNFQPTIQLLKVYAGKWLYIYKSYLIHEVESGLDALDVFLCEIGPDIQAIANIDCEISSFMKTMKLFNRVRHQQVELDDEFTKIKLTVQVLTRHSLSLPPHAELLFKSAPSRWHNLKLTVNEAKQRLGPRVREESPKVVKMLHTFENELFGIVNSLRNTKVYRREIDQAHCKEIIQTCKLKLEAKQKEAQDLIQLQELLEKIVIDFSLIQRAKEELDCLTETWETFRVVMEQQRIWKQHKWTRIRAKHLKKGLDQQHHTVMQLPDQAHAWDVTMSLVESINEILACIPIMSDLSKASLRARHWKQLSKITSSACFSHASLDTLSLKEFMALGLQNKTEEVCEVVKKSIKEVAVENKLKFYEETWLSKVLTVVQHAKPNIKTGQFVVNNIAKITEELLFHQSSLQSMLSDVAARSFSDQIYKWQASLQKIEFFLNRLSKVQANWIEKENAFSKEDMQINHAEASEVFSKASNEFQSLVNSFSQNPIILQTGTKKSVLQRLETIETSLNKCNGSVDEYLSSQRLLLLLLLSKQQAFRLLNAEGNMEMICLHLHKLFPRVESFQWNEDHVYGFVSLHGEIVKFVKPVKTCVKVTDLLRSLQEAIKTTNRVHLACALDVSLCDELKEAGIEPAEQKDKIDKSHVFEFMLKTFLPSLPEHWTLTANSNAVMLSVKAVVSELIRTTNDKEGLTALEGSLHSIVVSLSEFLLAQTNVQLQKECRVIDSEINNPLQISVSKATADNDNNNNDVLSPVRSQYKSVQLLPYQVKLVEALIRYFSAERFYVEKLVASTTTADTLSFELRMHPDYVFDANTCSLRVRMDDMEWDYAFEWQPCDRSNLFVFPSLDVSLYWLASGVKQHKLNFVQTNGELSLVETLANLTGRSLFVYEITKETSVQLLADLLKGIAETGTWVNFKGVERFSQSVATVFATTLKELRNAMATSATTVNIWQSSGVPLNSTLAMFAESYTCPPSGILGEFRVNSFTQPDVNQVLRVSLFEQGMSLSLPFVSTIMSFFESLPRFLPTCFEKGVGLVKVHSLARCIKRNFVEQLTHKEGQKIARQLPSVIELNHEETAMIIVNSDEHAEMSLTEAEKKELEVKVQKQAIVQALISNLLRHCPTKGEEDVFLRLLEEHFPDVDVAVNLVREKESQRRKKEVKQDMREELAVEEICSVDSAIEVLSNQQQWGELCTQNVQSLFNLLNSTNRLIVCGESLEFSWHCINCYTQAYQSYYKETKIDVIRPSSNPEQQFLGSFIHGNWEDGVLPRYVRNLLPLKQTQNFYFLVIQGEITSTQFEQIQDIMLGGDCLTLPNGDTLKIPANLCILLQVSTLSHIPDDALANIHTLHTPPLDSWEDVLKHHFSHHSPTTREPHHLTKRFLYCLQVFALFPDKPQLSRAQFYRLINNMVHLFKITSEQVTISSDYNNYVYYASYCSFVQWMTKQQVASFSTWWRKKLTHEVIFPEETSFMDMVVSGESHSFICADETGSYPNATANQGFAHTSNTVRTSALLKPLLCSCSSFVILGETGAGKLSVLNNELQSSKLEDSSEVMWIQCSKETTSEWFWERLNEALVWKYSNVYQPVNNKKLTCVVKDLHLCCHESHEVVSLLVELSQRKQAYNCTKWQTIRDTCFIATYDPSHPIGDHRVLDYLMLQLPVIKFNYPSVTEQIDMCETQVSLSFFTQDDHQLMNNIPEVVSARRNQLIEMKNLLSLLLTVTIDIQQGLTKSFSKSVDRSHYQFTIHGLKRIFTRTRSPVLLDSDYVITKWYLQLRWEFLQIITNDVDRTTCQNIIQSTIRKHLSKKQMNVISDSKDKVFVSNKLKEKLLEETNIIDVKKCRDLLEETVTTELRKHSATYIELDNELVSCVFRLVETLESSFDRGHTLLVCGGYPTCGQTLVQLAAHFAEFNVVFVPTPKEQTAHVFKEEFVKCLIRVGLQKERMAVVVSGSQDIVESIFIVVDEFVSGGDMQFLFNEEQKINIANSSLATWTNFMSSVHENLRVVITMEQMDTESVLYHIPRLIMGCPPMLISHMTFRNLIKTATSILKDLNMEKEEIDSLAYQLSFAHVEFTKKALKKVFNSNFVAFVRSVRSYYKEQLSSISLRENQLSEMLASLKNAALERQQLQDQLQQQSFIYQQKNESCEALRKQIGQDRSISEEQQRILQKTIQNTDKLKEYIPTYGEAHKRALFKASVIERDIRTLVAQLDERELTRLRSTTQPDQDVQTVFQALIIIVKLSPHADLSWNKGSKRLLANIERFKEDLCIFTEMEFSGETLDTLKSYISKPQYGEGYFSHHQFSTTLDRLARYVKNVCRYKSLSEQRVGLLKERLAENTKQLEVVSAQAENMHGNLVKLESRLSDLSTKYEHVCLERTLFEQQVNKLNENIQKAQDFAKATGGFQEQFESELCSLKSRKDSLQDYVIVGACFVVYLGAYNHAERRHIVTNQLSKHLTCQEKLRNEACYEDLLENVCELLVGKDDYKSLLTRGLPQEDVVNACLMKRSTQPLFICDTDQRFEQQFLPLILNEREKVVRLQQRDDDLVLKVEKCVSEGDFLLVYTEGNEINPMFKCLLNHQVAKDDTFITWNGRQLACHRNFRLAFVSDTPPASNAVLSSCACIDLSLSPVSVEHHVRLLFRRSLYPNRLRRKQQLLWQKSSLEANLSALDVIGCIAGKDCRQLWDGVTILNERISKRKKIGELLKTIEEGGLNENEGCIDVTPYVELFELFKNTHLLNASYRFPTNHFLSFLKSCLHLKDDIVDQQFIYRPGKLSNIEDLSQFVVNPLQLHENPSPDLLDSTLTKFKKAYLQYLKGSLSTGDFEVFSFIYSMKTRSFKNNDEEFLTILTDPPARGASSYTAINKIPDWLPAPKLNHLLNANRSYPPLNTFMQVFSQQPSMVQFWYDKPSPETSVLPQPTGTTISNMAELRLLATKTLRPDRFYFALRAWAEQNNNQDDIPSTEDTLKRLISEEEVKVFVLLNDTQPQSLLSTLAKLVDGNIVEINSSEVNLCESISSIGNTTCLIVHQFHLVDQETAFKFLQGLHKEKRPKVFISTNDLKNISSCHLEHVRIISLTSLLQCEHHKEVVWYTDLQRHIFHTLQSFERSTWDKLEQKALPLRQAFFKVCCIYAYLTLFYKLQPLSRFLVSRDDLNEALNKVIEANNTNATQFLKEFENILCESLFSPKVLPLHENVFITSLIRRVFNSKESNVELGVLTLPLPNETTKCHVYSTWLQKQFEEMNKRNKTHPVDYLTLVFQNNLTVSDTFLEKLTTLRNGLVRTVHEDTNFVQRLHENICQCSETLPKQLLDGANESGDKLVDLFLMSEIDCYNNFIRTVLDCVYRIAESLPLGIQALPAAHVSEARSIAECKVPKQWCSVYSQTDVTLFRWIKELRRRYTCLKKLRENPVILSRGGSPTADVFLGVMEKPAHLLQILMKKFADDCRSNSEVILEGVFTKPEGDCYIAVGEIYVEGASLYNCQKLDFSRNNHPEKLPTVYIRACVKKDQICFPVFKDHFRRKLLLWLALPSSRRAIEWTFHRPALMLNDLQQL